MSETETLSCNLEGDDPSEEEEVVGSGISGMCGKGLNFGVLREEAMVVIP